MGRYSISLAGGLEPRLRRNRREVNDQNMKCLGKRERMGMEPETWRGEIKRLPVVFSRPSGPQRLSVTAARPDESMKERDSHFKTR